VKPSIAKAIKDRSEGRCEVCGAAGEQFDHAEGRKHSESLETVWHLCAFCHFKKTNNQPSARHWLEAFIRHCARYEYREPAIRAHRRLDGMVAVREAEKAGRA
jgi:hypothetical protein